MFQQKWGTKTCLLWKQNVSFFWSLHVWFICLVLLKGLGEEPIEKLTQSHQKWTRWIRWKRIGLVKKSVWPFLWQANTWKKNKMPRLKKDSHNQQTSLSEKKKKKKKKLSPSNPHNKALLHPTPPFPPSRLPQRLGTKRQAPQLRHPQLQQDAQQRLEQSVRWSGRSVKRKQTWCVFLRRPTGNMFSCRVHKS